MPIAEFYNINKPVAV